MKTLILLIVAFLPSVLLGLYIWYKDPQKEPKSWLICGFVLGGVVCSLVAMVEMGIEDILYDYYSPSSAIFGLLSNAFIATAIPEESFKLLVLWILLRKNPYYDEHIDGIVYAVFIGLGFAAIENVRYLYGDANWITTALVRSLLAVPGHYAYAVTMGFYYSLYHFVEHSPQNAAFTLLMPVLLHGIYDSLAMSGRVNPYVGVACFFILIVFCIRIHWMARSKILALIRRDKKQ